MVCSIIFLCFAYVTQPQSHLRVNPFEKIFHTQLRIPLIFQLILPRNHFRACTAFYFSDLPHNSHYQPSDLNLLFHGITLERISTLFVGLGAALLQLYSNVYLYALEKIKFLAYIVQNTFNLDKRLPRFLLSYIGISNLFNFQ